MSAVRSEEFIFIWKISNFSYFNDKKGTTIETPVFRTNNFDGSQWYMKLYSHGDKIYPNIMSIFLCRKKKGSEENLSIAAEIEFLTLDGISMGKATTSKDLCKENSMQGFSNFLLTSNVFERMKNTVEDVLTIRCRIFCDLPKTNPPEYMVLTNVLSFLWEVKLPRTETEVVNKDFSFSKDSAHKIALSWNGDVVKVCIVQEKDETVLPKFLSCNLILLSSKGDTLASIKADHLFEGDVKNDKWELPSFITKAMLQNNKNILLEDDITLLCDLTASNGTTSSLNSCDGSASVKHSSFSTLQRELKSMLLKNIHSDIKLKVEDEVVHAHKSILAARSPVFSAMFDHDMSESQTGNVDVSDMDASTLKSFLEYIYTGKVEIRDYEIAEKLLLAADKYEVLMLKEECADFLKSILSVDNVCDMLSVADMIGHKQLKTITLDFIGQNSAMIFISPLWTELIARNVKLAGEVVANITTNFKLVPKSSTI